MTTRTSFASLTLAAASLTLVVTAVGCGGSFPPPNERMAQAEGAIRGAQEVGGQSEPRAALHLKLAQEQVDKAKVLMKDGENQAADDILMRAQADAELSLALAREASTRKKAKELADKVKAFRDGAKK